MRDEGGAGYGRFGALSRVELERFFHLDPDPLDVPAELVAWIGVLVAVG
ncbi:hypothetical protein KHQ06_25245 [Nocardia tengchongensis]|uniref:Uncharacterized protein n=1 Tax=Nocardia tengchongensis TaxID=2055889 RepID=A0ABX8CI56_9NOCA|nr:hypothetical protein [Nocardia tengchongensis]QVI19654.1 hypothetical protein KHQ06_25245 [Nocardia tengchongensis]